MEIDAVVNLLADSNPLGTREFITVSSGEVIINVDNTSYNIAGCDSMRFRADTPHSYFNNGKELCKICMVIYYQEQ